MPTASKDLRVVQGESLHEIAFQLRDANGVVVSLTGYDARLELWTSSVNPTRSDATLVRTLSSSDPVGARVVVGTTSITLDVDSATTADWSAATLWYRLWLVLSADVEIVVSAGEFTIER